MLSEQMTPHIRRASMCWLAALLGWTIAGCSSPVYQSAPVDTARARETLSLAMESWKKGEKPEGLQQQSPPIIVQDFDWTSGMKLVSYKLLDEGKAVDANLVAQVRLTLQDNQGGQSEKTVTYVVGTNPALTVFRDALN